MIDLADITTAAGRIAGHVIRTPAVSSPGLSETLGVPVTGVGSGHQKVSESGYSGQAT
jgi:hypothetical protein